MIKSKRPKKQVKEILIRQLFDLGALIIPKYEDELPPGIYYPKQNLSECMRISKILYLFLLPTVRHPKIKKEINNYDP